MKRAFCSTGGVTKEQFLENSIRFYWSLNRPLIEDEWLVQAWEQNARFRDEATCEFQREASKIGVLDLLNEPLHQLSRALPLQRMVALYLEVRVQAFRREPEFRPAFERVFGEGMKAFPKPLALDEIDEQVRMWMGKDEQAQ